MRSAYNIGIDVAKVAVVLYVPLSFTLLPPPSIFHHVIGYTGVCLIVFFLDQARRAKAGIAQAWLAALAIVAAADSVYFLLAVERLSFPLTAPPYLDFVVGSAILLIVLEAARRLLGPVLPVLAIALGLYVVFGRSMPGLLYHPGFSVERTVFQLTGSLQGVYGQIPTIIVTVVAIFLVFGAVIQGAGISDFFVSIARYLSSRLKSGAGLTAVLMSTLFGAISGAPVANVGTTGSFTIPLMRKSGFKAEEAAAIEGVASTGSQIIPPVLGTSAFIMAQLINRPYTDIVAVSIFPSAMFIVAVALTVHALGTRRNTQSIDATDIGHFNWAKGYLLIPVVLLVYALMQGFSPQYAAFLSTLAVILLFVAEAGLRLVSADGRRNVSLMASTMWNYLVKGADSLILVVIAGAIIGVIVQLLTIPLTIQRLSSIAIYVADGNLIAILLIVGFATLVLGTGLPTAATYVLVALLFAPTLTDVGVDPLAAHMFVFYLGVAADITPPVAMAILTASGIAGAGFWRACGIGLQLGFPIFLLPFLFVLQPETLIPPSSAYQYLTYASILAGVVSTVAASTAYLFHKLSYFHRMFFLCSAILGLWPSDTLALPSVSLLVFFLTAFAVYWDRLKSPK